MKVLSQGASMVNATAESGSYEMTTPRANERRDQLVANNFAAVYFAAAMRVVHDFCKRKKRNPAKELRLISGHGIRACERYLSGDRVGGFNIAVDLVFTPEGIEHVDAWRAERLKLGLPVPIWIDDYIAFVRVRSAMEQQQFNQKQAEVLQKLNDKL